MSDTHTENFFITAWHAYKANIRTAALIAAGLLLVEWLTTVFSSKFVEYAGPIMLVAMFAYAIHYRILFGTNANLTAATSNKPFSRFFWRSLIFFVVLIVILAAVFLGAFLILGKGYGAEALTGWSIILFVIVGLPMFGASFALIGTILPATVAGADASLATAWKRAKGNFWYTFLRLALGPFLAQMVILGLGLWAVSQSVTLDLVTANGSPDPVGIVFSFAVQMANLFVTALAASVLCKTYLRGQNEAPASAP